MADVPTSTSSDDSNGGSVCNTVIDWRFLAGLLVFIALALAAFYFPYLSGANSIIRSDIPYYFEPMYRFIGERLRSGQLPLWNPWLNCGMSQIAIPSPCIFYPFTLLFCIPNFNVAYSLFLIVHGVITAAGAYLLINQLGWGRYAAVFAGICAALNGYMFTAVWNPNFICGAAWPLLTIYLLMKVSGEWSRRNVIWWFATCLSIFCLITAGRPEIFAPSLLVAGMYIVIDALAAFRRKQFVPATLAWRLGGIVGGILLSMPMLAPAIEWWHLSYRAEGMPPEHVLTWSANWYDFIGTFLMQPVGNLSGGSNPYAAFIAGRPGALSFIPSIFITPITILLALRGVLDNSWKGRWWLVLLAVLSVIVSAGKFTPFLPLFIAKVPGMTMFRYPIKAALFLLFALIVLASRGFYLIETRRNSRVWMYCCGAVVFGALVTAINLFVFSGSYIGKPAAIPIGRHIDFFDPIEKVIGRSLWIAGSAGLVFFLAALANEFRKVGSQVFAWVTITIAVLMLSINAFISPPINEPGTFWSAPGALANDLRPLLYDAKQRTYTTRFFPDYFEPLYGSVTVGQDFTNDLANYVAARDLMFASQSMDFQLPNAYGYEGSQTGRYKELTETAMAQSTPGSYATISENKHPSDRLLAEICKMCAVSHVTTMNYVSVPAVVSKPLEARYFNKVSENPRWNYRIFQCKDTRKRAYFAPSVEWVDNWKPMFDRLFLSSSSNMISEVFVRKLPAMPTPQLTSVMEHHDSDRGVSFEIDKPEYVRLHASAEMPRMLILADTAYPGWRCFLDGKETTWFKANGYFRAVMVPQGEHTVEFRFQPDCLLVGLIAAFAVIPIAAGLWLFCRQKETV